MVAHLLYTQVLEDTDPAQRELGFAASAAWYPVVDRVAVYTDHGTSEGMLHGIHLAETYGIPVTYRSIGQ